MVFKNVDEHLTTIFNKVKGINSGFDLTSDIIGDVIDRFNDFNINQDFGDNWANFINNVSSQNQNVADLFEELAKQGASTRANIQGVYAAILDGNTKGINNVKSVINTFNSVNPQNPKDFAAAVGQTNAQLGNYLSNVQGGTASMKNYVGQLVATKAATIGLQLATIALNTALFAGISWLISKGIQALSDWYKSQEELRQKAEESAKAYNEQTKALQDLRQQYIDIVDSEKSASEKTEELNKWKQTLIETYGFEKEALENVNLEREKGLGLLDDEIEKQNRDSRGEWLGENESQIEKAKKKINELYYGAESNGQISTSFFNKIDADEVSDSIRGLFSNVYELGAEGNWQFTVDGDNLIEKYENIQKIVSELGNSKNLTSSEENLLKALNKESDNIKDILDEYQDIYEKYYEFTSLNNFEDYKRDNPIEDVGKNSYLAWKQGLLETANGDVQLIKELTELAEKQFPDYEKFFENREIAYKTFGVENVSDTRDGEIKTFINSLSDEDLEAAIHIPDLFKNGLDNATALIEAWKKDPKNKIEADVEVDAEEEMTELEKLQKSIENTSKKISVIKTAMKEMSDTGYSRVANEPSKVSSGAELIEKLLTKMGAKPDIIKGIVDNLNNNRVDPRLYNIMFNSTQQPTQDTLRQFEGRHRIDPNSYEVANKSTNETYTITSAANVRAELLGQGISPKAADKLLSDINEKLPENYKQIFNYSAEKSEVVYADIPNIGEYLAQSQLSETVIGKAECFGEIPKDSGGKCCIFDKSENQYTILPILPKSEIAANGGRFGV